MDGNSRGGSILPARGANIEFYKGGAGDRLLVLHDAKDLRGWHPYHDRLAQHHEVLAPVHPGFGLSERSPEIETVDDLAYFYLDLIDDQGWGPVHLAGMGIGGWIAAEMAVRSCENLRSLTLVDAVGIKISDPATPDITDVYPMPEEDRDKLLWHDPGVGRDIMGDPKTMSPEELGIFLRNEESETLFTWKPFMHNPGLRRRLHRVRVPTLVLWGEHDGVVSADYGQSYAQAIPGARFATIPAAAHLPHLERPDAVADAVHRFIGGLGA